MTAPTAEAAVTWSPAAGTFAWTAPYTGWDRDHVYRVGDYTTGVGDVVVEAIDDQLHRTTVVTRTATGGISGIGTSSLAVGPTPEDAASGQHAPTVGYFWGWNGADVTGCTGANNFAVWRLRSGATTMEVACVALPSGWYNAEVTGGEVDQTTGNIYFQAYTRGQVDNQSPTSTTINTSAETQFLIWNPSTGESIWSSQYIQPATQAERVRLKSNASGTGNIMSRVVSDMALDANGNIYLMVAREEANRAALVRVVPTRDQNGKITNGSCTSASSCSSPWEYNVVNMITPAPGTGTTWSSTADPYSYGSAFLNGLLYVGTWRTLSSSGASYDADRTVGLVDPLSGYMTGAYIDADWAGRDTYVRDFASAQSAAVIQGTVYNDVNGNGTIEANEPPLANQQILIYDENNVLRGVQTTSSEGTYSFLIGGVNEDTGSTYYIRLAQPYVPLADGTQVHAVQTYANGGAWDQQGNTNTGEPLNNVEPQCWKGADASQVNSKNGGACYGNFNPYDAPDKDPGAVGSSADPLNDFAIVSVVTMVTADDVADADFGVSTAFASWGDGQCSGGTSQTSCGTVVRSTAANLGPYHVNQPDVWVRLGSALGSQSNGVNDAASNDAAHQDDGVYVMIQGDAVPVQDALFSVGRQYTLRADATISDPIPNASLFIDSVEVKGWVTAIPSSATGNLAAFNNTPVINGVPTGGANNLTGSVTSTWNVPTGTVSGGLAPAVLRVNASVNDNITTPDNQAGTYAASATNSNTNSWVTTGEIEDYRVWYASAQVRLGLRTVGGTYSESFTLSNPVVNSTGGKPSSNSDVITTTTPGQTRISSQGHALSSTTQALTITPATPASPWAITGAVCTNTETNAPLTLGTDYTYNSSNGVVIIAAGALNDSRNDVTCVWTLEKAPSPATSEFTLNPASGETTVGSDIVGTITVRDADGNHLAGQTVQLSSDSGDVTLKDSAGATITECVTGEDGTCQVYISSVLTGTYTDTVHAKVNVIGTWTEIGTGRTPANPATASPKTVKFNPVDAAAQVSEMVITPANASQAVKSNYTVTVTAKDTYGNKVPGTVVTFTSTEPTVSFSDGATCTTEADGTCHVTFTSTKAGGPYDIHALIGGTDVGGNGDAAKASPQSRSFTAGPPAAHCAADAPAGTVCSSLVVTDDPKDAGENATVVVTLTDAYGNPIAGKSQSDLVLSVSPAGPAFGTFTEGAAGVYTGSVTSEVPGDFTVKAQPAPLAAADALSDVATFDPGPISAEDSTFQVTPAGPLPVGNGSGSTYTATVNAYDGVGTANGGKGNPVPGAVVSIEIAVQGGGAPDATLTSQSSTTCTTGDGTGGTVLGQCSITFWSKKATTYVFTAATDEDEAIGVAQNRSYTAGSISAAESSIEVTPNVEVGENAAVTITLKDQYGNPISGLSKSDLNLSAVRTGGAAGSATFGNFTESSTAGVYEGTVTATTTTTFDIKSQPAPLTADEALTDQTIFSTIESDWRNSSLAIDKDGPLTVGTGDAATYTLTVTARDTFGNPVAGQVVGFEASQNGTTVTGTQPAWSADTCTTGDGTGGTTLGVCSVTVKSTRSGTFDFHALIGGHDVGSARPEAEQSPKARTWRPSPVPDPANSTLDVEKLQMRAGETSVVHISLRDSYNNPITGLTTPADLELASSPVSSPAVPGGQFTNLVETPADSGDYTVDFTTRKAQSPTTVTAFGGEGGLKDTINVKGGAIDPDTVTLTATPATVTTNAYSQLTLSVSDIYGNPVEGLDQSYFEATHTLGHGITQAWDGMTVDNTRLAQETAPGQYSWWVRSSTPKASYWPEISVTYPEGGTTVAKQTSVTVNAGTVSDVQISASPSVTGGDVVSTPADAKTTVTVAVHDANGAPVTGLTVSDFSWAPVAWKNGRPFQASTDWLIKTGSFTDNGDGTYTFLVASQRSGTYVAAVEVSGVESTNTVEVTFIPGPPAPPGGVDIAICPLSTAISACTDTTQDEIEAVRGQARLVAVILDAFGNAVELTDAELNASLTSDYSNAVTSASGVWNVEQDTYGNRTGRYSTLITVPATQPLPRSYEVTLTSNGLADTDKVKFISSPVGEVTLALDATTHEVCKGTTGNCVKATVHVTDTGGAAITGLSSIDFALTSDPTGVSVNTNDAQWAPVSGQPGYYESYIYSTRAANFSVKVNVAGTDSNAVSIRFTAAAPCDADDENCPDPEVNPANDRRSHLEVTTDNQNGDGTARDVVAVYLYDAFGNPAENIQVRACASGCTAGVAVFGTIAPTDADGRTSVQFTATSGGAKTVTIQYSPDGGTTWRHVVFKAQTGSTPPASYKSSPLTINFKAVSFNEGTSDLTITPNPAEPGDPVEVTFTAKDGEGNPVSGIADKITLNPDGLTGCTGPTEDPAGSGTYKWTGCDATTVPGQYEPSVIDEKGNEVTEQFTVDVIDTPSPATSTLAVDRTTQTVTQPVVVTITAKTAAGQAISNLTQSQFTITGNYQGGGEAGTPNITTFTNWTNVGNGVYTMTITTSKAGDYKIVGTAKGVTITNAQPTVTFEPDEICIESCTPDTDVDNDHRSRLVVETDNAIADGNGKNKVTAYLFDAHGNARSGVTVTSTAIGASVATSPIAATNASGATVIEYTSMTPGAHEISVKVGGANITFTPQPGTTAPANYRSSPTNLNWTTNGFDPENPGTQLVVSPNPAAAGNPVEVTFTAKDSNGSPASGLASGLTLTPDGLTGCTGPTEDPAGSGVYKWSGCQASTTTGDYTPKVTDSAGHEESASFRVDPGLVSAANSNLTASPTSQTVGQPVRVVVTVKDANNNAVSNLTAGQFTITGAYQANSGAAGTPDITGSLVTFVSNEGNGVYYFDVTSKKTGQFQLTGVVAGVTLNQHPVITFTAAGVCVSNCEGDGDPDHVTHATVTRDNQKANGTDSDQVTVWAYDSYGNVVPGAAIVANRDGNTALTPGTVNGTTGTDGTYVISWTSTQAGSFKATISVDGLTGFAGWAPEVSFNPLDDPSPNRSALTVDTEGPLTVGGTYTLTATVRDANGNELENQTVSFSASPAGVTIPATCTTNSSGVCQVTATSTTAGSFTVHGQVNVAGTLTDIQGANATEASPKTLVWNAGTACVPPVDTNCSPDPLKQTRVDVTLDSQTANGSARDEATVYVFDRYGNPVQGVTYTSTANDSLLTVVAPGSGTTGANGQGLLQYTSITPGAYRAAVTIAGKPAAQSPIQLSFIHGTVNSVAVSAAPATAQTVGNNFTLAAHAEDATGNGVPGVAVTFQLPADLTVVSNSNGTTQKTCSTDANGNCSIQITSTKAGQYTIPVQSSPAASPSSLQVEFKAGAVSASASTVEIVKNGSRPDGTEKNVVRVTARDQYGNPVSGAVVQSTTTASQMTVVSPIPATAADGTANIEYTATVEGAYPATIQIGGVTPTGGPAQSPVTLSFNWTVIDPSKSTWTVTPASPLQVGTGAESTYTATVTARDANNQPAGNATVTFAIDPAATGGQPAWGASGYTCTTNSQGTCSVTISSTKSGTYTLSAGVPAGTIGTAQTIAWLPDEVCATGCTPLPGVPATATTRYEVTVNNQVADDTTPDIVTVWAFDKYGNPVPNQPVGAATDDSALRIQANIQPTGADGSTTIQLFSKVAGQHDLDEIWIGPTTDKKIPADLPATVTFIPGGVCLPNEPNCPDPSVPNDKRTRLEITTDNQTADGTSQDVITVYAFDRFGNAVVTQVRSTAPSAVTVPSTITPTSATTGSTTIAYTTTVAASYQVVVQLQNQGAWQDVVFTPQPGSTPPSNYTSSPATITFKAGEICIPDATANPPVVCSTDPDKQTHVEVTVNNQKADGTSANQATVYAYDALGNAVSGVAVASAPAGTVSPGTLTVGTIPATGDDGTTVINYTTTTAHTAHSATVHVTVNGQQVEIKHAEAAKSSPVALSFVREDELAAPTITKPTPGQAINSNTPEIAGTGEPGNTVTIKDGSTVIGTTTVGDDGTWSYTPETPLTEGSHSVTATQTDPGTGDESEPSAPVNFKVDTQPPAAPTVTSPADGSKINDSTPTIEGTAEPGSVVTVKDGNGQVLCTDDTVGSDRKFSCTVPPEKELSDGDVTLAVTATDPAGNVSPPKTVTTTIDTEPPATPTVTKPADGSTSNDPTPVIEGAAEEGSTVKVTDETGDVICEVTANSEGKYSCPVPDDKALDDGEHTLSVTATDPAGNTSPAKVITVTTDTEPPEAPTVTKPANNSQINDTTPTIEGTAEEGSTVTVKDGSGQVLCTDTTVGADGKFSCTVPPEKALPEGPVTLAVTQTDKAGNVSDPTTVKTTIDDTAPNPPAITSPAPGSATNDTTPTIAGTAEAGSTVKVTDENGTLLCTATANSQGRFTCPAIPEDKAFGEGEHELTATATDKAGNVSDPATALVDVDLTPPEAPVVNHPVNNTASNDTTPTFDGTAEPGSKVTVTDENGRELCSTNASTTGAWTCDVDDDKELTEGAHTFEVTATDAAGNESEPTTVTTRTDLVAPPKPVVTSPKNNDQINDTTPTVTGTGEAGATVSVKDGNGQELCHDTVAANGTWTCTVPGGKALPEGVTNLNVTQTDPAGNESPATTVKVTVDTVPPAAPTVTKPADGSSVNDSTPTFEGTAEGGSTVTITDDDGTEICQVKAAADGKWTCTVDNDKALEDGEHTFTVTATDPAGNESEPTTVETKVDTDTPDKPVVTKPADGDSLNDTTPTFEGTGEPGARVDVTDGDEVICSVTVGTDGKWTCTVPDNKALDEGDHDIKVTQTDPAGNKSDPTEITVDVDTTPPTAPTVTKPDDGDAVNDTTPTIEGTAEAGSTVTVTDGDNEILCQTTAGTDGKYTCTVKSDKALPEGPATIKVTATDPAGNNSPATVIEIEVDTTAPDAPNVTEPRAGQAAGATPVVKGIDGEEGNTITVTDKATGQVLCTTDVKAGGTWECPVGEEKALSDGPHTISVTETDKAGNVSQPTEIPGLRINPDQPTVPTVDTSDDTKISGTSDTDTTIDVTDKDGNAICSNVAVGSDGKWSCTPSTPLQPGDQITVTATDPDGETSSITVRKLRVTVGKPSLLPGEQQTASGMYFQPGESVTATMYSDPYQVGTATADANGTVTFTWTVPASTTPGQHTIELVGETSGPGRATFTVSQPQPNTGAPVDVRFATAAGLSSLIGIAFILFGWRRRRDGSEMEARRAA